jgi:GAF domain-containing protein
MSAMLAAGVFAPTQNVVLGWTKRHFGKDADKLRGLAARLAVWRNTESAAEMGMRALAIVAESVHAGSAAILALTPTGRELIAARDVEDPEALAEPGALDEDDPRFPLSLPLEDEDGPVGTLLIGPRSDGNRYNKDEREVLSIVTEPLAEAIRFANLRAAREDGMQKMIISAVEERLAQLNIEPSPKPA